MDAASAPDGLVSADPSGGGDDVETRGTPDGAAADASEGGLVDRWRSRANRAADRYQARAQEQPLFGLPLAFVARYTARQGVLLASAVAFRLFLWLLPLALLLAGILSGVTSGNTHSLESASKTAGITGTASNSVIQGLHNGKHSWWFAVVAGALLFLWASRTLMQNLIAVHRHAWGLPPAKTRQRRILVDAFIFAGGFIVALALVIGILRLDRHMPAGVVLSVVLETAVVFVLWFFFSRRLPGLHRDPVDLLPGAIIVGVAMSVLHAVSRIYLPRKIAQASAMYGALGIAATMLAWLLIFGQVVVCAALANAVWAEYRAERRAHEQPAETTTERA